MLCRRINPFCEAELILVSTVYTALCDSGIPNGRGNNVWWPDEDSLCVMSVLRTFNLQDSRLSFLEKALDNSKKGSAHAFPCLFLNSPASFPMTLKLSRVLPSASLCWSHLCRCSFPKDGSLTNTLSLPWIPLVKENVAYVLWWEMQNLKRTLEYRKK